MAKTSDHKDFFACKVFSYKGWANFSLYSRVFRRSNLLARPHLSTQKKSIKPKYMFDQKTRTIGFYPLLPRMNLQLLFLMRFHQKLWKRELCTLNIFGLSKIDASQRIFFIFQAYSSKTVQKNFLKAWNCTKNFTKDALIIISGNYSEQILLRTATG